MLTFRKCSVSDEYDQHVNAVTMQEYLRKDKYLSGYTELEQSKIKRNLGVIELDFIVDHRIDMYSSNALLNKVIFSSLENKVNTDELCEVSYTAEYKDILHTPQCLPNPEILAISGLHVTGLKSRRQTYGVRSWSYDGREAVLISLPVYMADFPDYADLFISKEMVLEWIPIHNIYLNRVYLEPDEYGKVFINWITEEEVDEKINAVGTALDTWISNKITTNSQEVLDAAENYTDTLYEFVTLNATNITELQERVELLATAAEALTPLIDCDIDDTICSRLSALKTKIEAYYVELYEKYDSLLLDLNQWLSDMEEEESSDYEEIEADISDKHASILNTILTLQANYKSCTSTCTKACASPAISKYEYVVEHSWASSPLVWNETSGATYISGHIDTYYEDGSIDKGETLVYMRSWHTKRNQTSSNIIKTAVVKWGDTIITELYTQLCRKSLSIDLNNINTDCVSIVGTNADVTSVFYGTSYIIRLKKKTGYATIGAGKVYMGGVVYQSWEESQSTQVVKIDSVISDVLIAVDCGTPSTLNVSFDYDPECMSIAGLNSTIAYGETANITVTVNSDYYKALGAGVIYMGDDIIYTWDSGLQSFSYTILNITGDISISADCGELITYTVSFDDNGGTGTISPLTVTLDSVITLPESGFTRIGYVMDGWSKVDGNNSARYDLGEKYTVTGDVMFYASWDILSYTVSYDTNGGSGAIVSQTSLYKSTITLALNGFEKEGYTLVGWALQPDATTATFSLGAAFTMPATDITLYAIWVINTYTVRYDDNGGTGTLNSIQVTYGTEITLMEYGFTRVGYTLAGWTTTLLESANIYSLGETYTVTGDITFYAAWTVNTYTLSYDSNGGEGTIDPYLLEYNSETRLAVDGITRDGYTLIGWASSRYNIYSLYTLGQIFFMPASDITLYAIWQEAVINVTDVTIEPETLNIKVDEAALLTATVEPVDATNTSVVWTLSDSSIAMITRKGIITGIKAGTVSVIVTTEDGGYTAICNVTVSE